MQPRTIDLNYQPRDWQARVHTQRKRFTVVAVHRRGGKSEVAIMELINAALNFKHDLGLFFYVAPLLKQAKIIAWQRIKQRCAHLVAARLCEINESELFVRFTHNGATIRIYGADNPDAMRGVRLAVRGETPKPEMTPGLPTAVALPSARSTRVSCEVK